MTRRIFHHSLTGKPEVEIHLLSTHLPDDALKWVELFCMKIGNKQQISRFSQLQKGIHGLVPYLLVARDWPAIIIGASSDLKRLINREIKKYQLEWLKKDAFILFVTDEEGMRLANDVELNAYTWSESALHSIAHFMMFYTYTSIMRGYSRQTFDIRKKIIRYAITPPPGDLARKPVLILGPSRSGKEIVAQALYQTSRLPDNKFEAIGCGMIQPQMLLDQLFGHWEGAFTGAGRSTPGYLELCSGGAVFLDDFDAAENPRQLQSALLRFMATNPPRVRRLGFPTNERDKDKLSVSVTTWLLFATNRSPRQMIQESIMREDFLLRFDRIIKVSPFNTRRQDVPHIAKALLRSISDSRPLDVSALRWLRDRESDWRGNASEVKALLVCANELLCECPTLTWVEAFTEIIRRGDDFLDWYESGETERVDYSPSSPEDATLWKLLLNAEKIRSQSRKNEIVVTLLNTLRELADNNSYNKILKLKERLDQRPSDNPAQIHCFRFLLYLIFCSKNMPQLNFVNHCLNREQTRHREIIKKAFLNENGEVTKQRVIEGVLNLSWKTVNIIGKTLADASLVNIEQKKVGDRPYFLYTIDNKY